MRLAVDEVIQNYDVTREKRASAYNMPDAHYHDHYEIYFLAKGSVRYFIGDRVFDLEEGDIVLIPPHVIHRTATLMNKGSERIVIAFTNEFIMYPQNDRLFSCFKMMYFKNPPVRELVEKAESEFIKNDRYSEELIAGYIREILVKLKRLTGENNAEEYSYSGSIIQGAVHYILENYSQELSLSMLASDFALSESHFSRQFKMFTGFGVNEYIATVRVKNAEKLLATTTLPVTVIAQNCGFNSSSYFAAVFKKIRGISPGEVRRKRRVKE
jgi:AraC-like DNA-binding protein